MRTIKAVNRNILRCLVEDARKGLAVSARTGSRDSVLTYSPLMKSLLTECDITRLHTISINSLRKLLRKQRRLERLEEKRLLPQKTALLCAFGLGSKSKKLARSCFTARLTRDKKTKEKPNE